MKVVLDTNVLISGAFFGGTPRKILDACLTGRYQLVVSPEILDEYQAVGQRFLPESDADFAVVLAALLKTALLVETPALDRAISRDPFDDKFIACALAGKADLLVSGDKDLLDVAGEVEVPIVRPREFLAGYLNHDQVER